MFRITVRPAGMLALGLTLAGSAAFGSPPAVSTYESLGDQLYQAPMPVPSGGVRLQSDRAVWHLDEGVVSVGATLADGTPTGLVFEGRGRFVQPVDDKHELYQLRRFMEEPEAAGVDTEISKLVLRTSDPTLLAAIGPAVGGASPNHLAKDRHEHWLERRGHDANARLVAARLTPGDLYVRAEMDSNDYGWLTWEYDAQRLEEIHLERLHGPTTAVESWLSLERQEDVGISRQRDWRPLLDVEHVDIEADLEDPDKGEVVAAVRFTTLEGPLAALSFRLSAIARLDSVVDESGRELSFFRPLVDKRGGYDDAYTRAVVVLLEEAFDRNEVHTLRFEYRMDLERYAFGGDWYPYHGPEDGGLNDSHTGRISVTMRKNYDVRAMGEKIEQSTDGKMNTATWSIHRPVKMMTFTSLRSPVEQTMHEEGVPEIVVFGPEKHDNVYFNIAADLTNSIRFFQQLFDDRLEAEQMKAGMVTWNHGQSFDGFLHLSYTDLGEHAGATELFRGHEVAHQWWGHIVGWDRYRDQWLSEAFAEYSAMMYVVAAADNGEKLFDEILRTYNEELTGSIKSAFSKFARPGVALLNNAALDRIGPIGHGWRATVHEAPTAYLSMAYRKGALVLHMLRGVLLTLTKSDETFLAILRDFIHTYRGDSPSTADFEAIVAKHAPADWSWFFEQWVYGCDIPTYLWDYDVSKQRGGEWAVTLEVTQQDVPADFRMLVPVEIDFGGGKTGRAAVMVDERDEIVTFAVPAKPKKVLFNPGYAVLAKVKKK